MLIIEISIYAIFAIIMYILAEKSYITTKGTRLENKIDIYLWLYISFYVFICAVRYGVGVDSISYAQIFIHGEKFIGEHNQNEILFNWFIEFIKSNGFHFTIGQATLAFLQIFPIVGTLKKHKIVLKYIPLVLFGSFYFLSLNNGVRQMIVACMFVYATQWIVKRNWICYFLFIVIARMIHTSSTLLLPFYFLPSVGKLANKRWLCLSILCFSLVAGMMPQFQFATDKLVSIMQMIGYDGYTERMSDILSGDTSQSQSFGLQKLSYFIGFLSFTFFGKELNSKYGKINPMFNIWWFYAFLYACLYFMVGGMSYLFQRPLMYIELYTMFMISYMMLYLNYGDKNNKIYYWLLIVVIWSSLAWATYKAMNMPSNAFLIESTTYKTIFNHKIK